MAQITIQTTGVTDTFLASADPDITHDETFIQIGEPNTAADVDRGLIKFDLSGIPAGATITSAILTLTIFSDLATNTRTLRAFRVKRAWVESQATWNIFSTGNSWGTAGCADTTNDREATDIGSVSVAEDAALDSGISITLTISAIQEMITGGSFTNNGFLLQIDTETDDAHRYYSTSHATSAYRPKLVIDYLSASGLQAKIW